MSRLVAKLRDVPQGDQRPLYYDTMEEAAARLEALEGVADEAIKLLWEHCEGLAPRIEALEALRSEKGGV